MKKTKSGRGINSMPAGTGIVTYICLVWALVVSLVPLGWLVLSSLKKDPMARRPSAWMDIFLPLGICMC